MSDNAVGIDYKNQRMSETVPIARGRHRVVQQPEGFDDRGFAIRQQRETDPLVIGKSLQHIDGIVGNLGDVVAQRLEVRDPLVPGDRLDLAVGSPTQRSGKQQDEAAFSRQRGEIP